MKKSSLKSSLLGLIMFFIFLANSNLSAQTYATLPFEEKFDNTWVNLSGTRDVPSIYWKSSPVTGNNSWSREDDGAIHGWTSVSSGSYSPAGAKSSLHSARFHSYYSSSTVGTLDLYVNLSTITGEKVLSFFVINTDGTDKLDVQLSTDGGVTFGSVLKTINISSGWTKYSVSLGTSASTIGIIRFKATGDWGNSDIGLDNVKISPLESEFASDINSGIFPLAVTFTDKSVGTPTAWKWDFNNDGITDATSQNPSYTYSLPGKYTVKLITYRGTVSDTIVKNNFVLVKNISYALLPVNTNFDNTWINSDNTRDVPNNNWYNIPSSGMEAWSRDDDGTNRGAWSYSGGSFSPTGANSTTHSARFNSIGTNGTGSMDLYFNGGSLAGTKALYFWYMNPEGSDNLEVLLSKDGGANFNSLNTYTTKSTWTKLAIDLGNLTETKCVIRFKAKGDFGNTTIGIDEVYIGSPSTTPIVPNFDVSSTTGTVPFKIAFNEKSTGEATSWRWDFDNDGTYDSFLQNPVYTFTNAGLYSVKMVALKYGMKDSIVRTNYLNLLPQTYATLPFNENFDGTWIDRDNKLDVPSMYSKNSPESGNSSWRRSDNLSTWNYYYTTFPPGSALNSPYCARFNSLGSGSGQSGILDFFIDFSTQTGSKTLTFYYVNTDGVDKLDVFVSTDGGMNFGPAITSQTTSAVWKRVSIDLGVLTSAKGVIRFKATGDNSKDIGIDEINIQNSALSPIDARFSADIIKGLAPLTVNFADGSMGLPTSWKWDFDNNGTTDLSTQNGSYTYTQGGFYSVKMEASKTNSTDIELKTNLIKVLGYASLPYSENFDHPWVDYNGTRDIPSVNALSTSVSGNGIWRRNDEISSDGKYKITGANGTTNSASFDTYKYNPVATLDFLINFSSQTGSKRLTFWYFNPDGNDVVDVSLSTDGGTTFGAALISLGVQNSWKKIDIDLGNVTSAIGVIRFKATSQSYQYYSSIGIDEIKVVTPSLLPLKADFTSNKTIGQAPLTINFTDLADGTPTAWSWDFNNDGVDEQNIQNPSYTFTTPGFYTIKQTITKNSTSISETKTNYLTVTGYSPLPFSESFENAWINRDFVRDVPSVYCKNTPAGGYASWSRNDDGVARGAWWSNEYAYTPTGANGTAHSARHKHDSNNSLDFYVDFSTLSGDKYLTFWYYNPAMGQIDVKVSTDGGATFGNSVMTQSYISAWTKFTVNLGNLTSPTGIVRFITTMPSGGYVGIDMGLDEISINNVQSNFSSNVVTGAAPLTVNFTDNSVGLPTSWKWDFNNDGVIDATIKNPSYTFTTPGNYSVKMVVNGSKGDSVIKTNYITVKNIQYAALPYKQSFEDPWINLGSTRDRPSVNWSNTPATGNNSWSRDDDGVARTAWTYVYGNYTPSGALSSAHSARFHSYSSVNSSTGSLDLYVNFSTITGDKELNFWYNNADGNDKLEISVSTDGGYTFGTILKTLDRSVAWSNVSINLGSFTSSTGVIRFKATSDNGNSDIGIDEIRVSALRADFSSNISTSAISTSISFNDLSFGSPTSWKWDFNNDGITDATEQNPTFSYVNTGKYNVKLVVANSNFKDSVTYTNYINIKPIQYASLPYNQDFENNWITMDSLRDVPSLNWVSTPAKANNSWSRNDDGYARGAWNNNYAEYYPVGANNSLHSARFHSYYTNLSGSLDLYVDFSTLSGEKALYFWYFNNSGSDNLVVSMSVDAGVTFIPLTTLGIKSSWSKICLNLGNITSKGILRFKATGDNGYSDLAIDNIYVGNHSVSPLVPAFSSAQQTGMVPLNILFSDISSEDITSWKWDFNGDGVYDSDLQNPSFLYNSSGTFPVKLVVFKGSKSDSLIKTDYINISPQVYAPVPFIESFENTWVDRNNKRDVPSLYFQNTPASGDNSWTRSDDMGRTWSTYDSYYATGALGTQNFAKFNSKYSNTLTGTLDLFLDFSINWGFQELSFWYKNTAGNDKLEIYLSKDGGASFGTVIKTVTIAANWTQVKVDLGMVSTAKGVIRFKATGDGSSEIGLDEIVVCDPTNTPIKANFSSDKISGITPLTVKFSDISMGTATKWKWDFNNDGIVDSISKNPSFKFDNPGLYSVKLKASNASSTDSITKFNNILARGYAKLPLFENFEENWNNADALRDVPSYYFKNTPATGENTWSRDDDGKSRMDWGSSTTGGYSPAGANGSLHSAKFHSYVTLGTGVLDMLVDFSSLPGNKTLTFWYVNTSGRDSLSVYLSTDGGATDGTLLVSRKIESIWTKIEVNLGDITTPTGVVRFKAKGDNGYSDIGLDDISIRLTAASTLQPQFTVNYNQGLAPLTVKFTNKSTGAVTSWKWDFNNDGIIDSEIADPTFTYELSGKYTVKLITSGEGVTACETKVNLVNVYESIKADFNSGVSEGFAPFAVGFIDKSTGKPESWQWDFNNDGITDANIQNPVYYYTKPGGYDVKLVSFNAASKDSLVKSLKVSVDGKASLPFIESFDDDWKSSRSTREVPSFCWRNAPAKAMYSWSRDDDGVLRGAWNSNGGAYSPAAADGSLHSARFHTYDFMSNYLSSFYLNVDFSSLAGNKTMSFYYINPNGSDKLEVFLSTDGGKTFGSALTTQTTSATWSNVEVDLGNVTSKDGVLLFKVTANLDNSDLGIDEFSIHTTGVTLPVANFSADKVNGFVPLKVKFSNLTTGDATSYKWDFNNDGIIDSTTSNPSYTFNKGGVYTVRLYAYKSGSIDTEVKLGYITAEDTLSIDFVADKIYGNDSLYVKFTDKSKGKPTSWKWDFNNDGTIDATTQNPVFLYTNPGKYTVKLIASKAGDTDSTVKINYITVKKVRFASLPFTETFEGAWVNSENKRDVPSYFWSNTPSTGESSWSREDDGKSRGAWLNEYNGFVGGSGSTLHSARFHSSATSMDGVMDLHVDFTTLSGDKALYFWYINTGGSDKLEVLVSADSGKVFTSLIKITTKDAWTKFAIDLGKINAKYGVIRFKASGDYGSSDIKIDEVYVGSHSQTPIKTEFDASSLIGYAPFTVSFNDKSTGDVVQWRWDFNNDGAIESTGSNPTYTFLTPGFYNVKLVASKSTMADSLIKYEYISILPQLYANLPYRESFDSTWINRDFVRDVPSLFTRNFPSSGNNAWSRVDDNSKWSFNYGLPYLPGGALGTPFSARFNTAGTSNLSGIFDIFVDCSTQSGEKTLSFWYINSSGSDKLEIYVSEDGGETFGSVLKTLNIQTEWSKINISLGTVSSKMVVRFKATGDGGLSDIGVDEIFIGNQASTPLKANFNSTKVAGTTPLKVNFTDQSEGKAESWKWDFNNDGVIDSTSQNPSYIFTKPGLYSVKLIVSNTSSKDSVVKKNLIVVPGFAKLPFVESFEKPWANYIDTRDIPSPYFKNTPATGNNSWSRNDDGVKRIAWSNNNGNYFTTGANGSLYSARFHSWATSSSGTLDLFVDFSSLIGEKTLTFWYMNMSGSDSLRVYLSNDKGITDGTLLKTLLLSNYEWTKVTVNIGNATNAEGCIRFKAYGDWGGSDIGLDDIQIGLKGANTLQAKFKADITQGSAPLTVKFTDQSTGTPENWNWDFNDDGLIDSTSKNPSYIFKTAGKYNVGLTISSAGAVDNELLTNYINVYDHVVSDFSMDKTEGIAPLSVIFTDKSSGNPSSWKWDMNNDGIIDSEIQNPIYNFIRPGNYTVKLISNNPLSGDTIVKTSVIHVSAKASLPFAENFEEGWKTNLQTRDVPSFYWKNLPALSNNSWSREDDGVNRGAWSTNDGAYSTSGASGSFHSARFHSSGSASGSTNNFTLNVDFSSLTGDKTLAFYYINTDGNDKLEVFVSTDGGLTYGSAVSTQTVSADWSKVSVDLGNITSINGIILFKVTTSLDNSDIGIDQLTIGTTGAPVISADFNSNVTIGIVPLKVTFNDLSTGLPSTWKWDMNTDGIVDCYTKNPVYTYIKAGTYSVNLNSSGNGASDSKFKYNYITVLDTVSANFTADFTSGRAPLTVKFTDKSKGKPTTWHWDFNNDGVVDSITKNPVFIFTKSGSYSVKLVVDNFGFRDSITRTDYIVVSPPTGVNTSGPLTKAVSVYPSPATSWTNIQLENFDDEKLKVEIVDLHGVVVANYDLTGQKLFKIDCSAFSRGAYYVKVVSKSQVYINNLILQ